MEYGLIHGILLTQWNMAYAMKYGLLHEISFTQWMACSMRIKQLQEYLPFKVHVDRDLTKVGLWSQNKVNDS
jgi:hypothetical protein